jgi:hypothetical protein
MDPMIKLQEQINRQRIQYIVQSYQLDGDESQQFSAQLTALLAHYPTPLIELALVEVLVQYWLSPPLPRGMAFLGQVQTKLQTWQTCPIVSTITPSQFHQITGLDPEPVFGAAPPAVSPVPREK